MNFAVKVFVLSHFKILYQFLFFVFNFLFSGAIYFSGLYGRMSMVCLSSLKHFSADCLCSLKIVDESHPKAGLEVRVFEEIVEKLPAVAAVGDIIQFNHVVVFPCCGFLFRK